MKKFLNVLVAALVLFGADMAFAKYKKQGKEMAGEEMPNKMKTKGKFKKCAGGACQRYVRKGDLARGPRGHMRKDSKQTEMGCVGTCKKNAKKTRHHARHHVNK
ncbi:MAG TPA: hypothetical protein VFF04_06660 [Candidatus Babeliales bacterium]|nr:hypothetical protein [Candidatus Babeliales bacterium]